MNYSRSTDWFYSANFIVLRKCSPPPFHPLCYFSPLNIILLYCSVNCKEWIAKNNKKHDELFSLFLSLEYLIIYAIFTYALHAYLNEMITYACNWRKRHKTTQIFEIRAHKTVLIVNGTRSERKRKSGFQLKCFILLAEKKFEKIKIKNEQSQNLISSYSTISENCASIMKNEMHSSKWKKKKQCTMFNRSQRTEELDNKIIIY